jgi:hypothetical protein
VVVGNAWSDTWVHADYVRGVGWSPNGGVISIEVWDAIGGAMKKTMAEKSHAESDAGKTRWRIM